MKILSALGVVLLVILAVVVGSPAAAVECELAPLITVECTGSCFDVSWTPVLSGCTATYDVETRCCGGSTWILLADDTSSTTYQLCNAFVCPGSREFRITMNCDCTCTNPCQVTSQCYSCP